MSLVYIFNIILTVIWGIILIYGKKEPKKKIFIAIVSLQAILISGLRGLSIGADTQNYSDLFWYFCKQASWKDVGILIKNFVLHGDYNSRDMGYYIWTKVFGSIIPSYRVYLFFVITVFMISIGVFFYKYSSDLCLSYIIFDSFMFQFYGLTGIRQTLATILVTFIGYEFIKKKKFVPFLVTCILAATIHMTSLVFFPFYFVCNMKDKKYKYLCVFSLVGIIVLFKNVLAKLLPMGFYGQMYSQFTGITSYNFIFMVGLVAITTCIMNKKIMQIGNNNRDFIDGTLIVFIIVASSIIFDLLFRLAWFYMPFLALLIPQILDCIENKYRRVLRIVLVVALTMLLYKNHLEYTFFWME